ncbi:MAG TPA: FlgD immunoglobulin-like domain containing protein, partial [Nocardioidaceae bacterium]|nr:FlgD immunoglobulin-like domain containing protein [Nocardioidaceae bacterium]
LPTMTAPHAHQTLTAMFNVQATSSHARIEFMLDDFDESVVLSTPVVSGTASAAFPSWGFTGDVRVRARECDGSVCGDFRSSPSGLTVVNEPLAVAQPSVPVDLTAGENTVPVVVPSAGGWVKVSLDGGVALQADGGINALLDFTHRPDGIYHPVARRCSPLDHTVCAEQADLPTIRVLRKLVPHGPSDPIPPISPNGDGVRDSAMRDITLLPSWAPALSVDAEWTLSDSDGDVATGPITLPAGQRATTFRIDPFGEGFTLDDGKYKLSVDASAVFDGKTIEGSFAYDEPIGVDATVPKLTNPKMSARTFYPLARKGQPRSVTATVDAQGVASMRLDIIDSNGDVVRSADIGSIGHGPAQYRWAGTRGNGKLAPAGRYRVVWTGVDAAGNVSEPLKGPWVTLSRKRQAP